jgi:hypothetical protein
MDYEIQGCLRLNSYKSKRSRQYKSKNHLKDEMKYTFIFKTIYTIQRCSLNSIIFKHSLFRFTILNFLLYRIFYFILLQEKEEVQFFLCKWTASNFPKGTLNIMD